MHFLFQTVNDHTLKIWVVASSSLLIDFIDSVEEEIKLLTVLISFIVLALTLIIRAMDAYDKIKARIDVEDGEVEVEVKPDDK